MGGGSQVAGRGPEGEVGDLRAALGPDLVVYAERFRVLEDRGRGPSQPDGSEGSGGGEVYSVLMEVTVDRDRVERRLEEQGLLVAAPLPSGPADPIGVEVRSIGSYADLEALEAALAAPSFAESVTPRAFERGRASLRVKTYESPAALAARLLESVPPDLDLRGVWVEQETVVVELAPAAD